MSVDTAPCAPACVPPAGGGRASEGHLRGLAFVFVAGLLYASAGLFTRGLPFDGWTMLFWRSLSGALFLIGAHAVIHRRLRLADYALDRRHWLMVPVGAVATICYVFALKVTTVANVMIVYATMPFVTAVVAYLWMREVPSRRLAAASAVALVGVLVMLAGGAGGPGRLLGAALMMIMNVNFALMLVMARKHPARSMTPLNVLALLAAAAVSFALSPHEAVGPGGFTLMILFGIGTIGFAMPLFMAGARLAPAAEVALIGISDVALGPLMVWLAFREDPGLAAMLGGAIVIGALLWNMWPELAGAVARRWSARRGTPSI